ncbi:uncharacterized protein LOC123913639 [Trifolium pratense]|uniref:uncharacterized protein LOC123913639 n=1 Tax=Trifolium pratense TaxID=57577 RepID=UPI001E695552|nr:uncharacterized protein LOC123913639 [Trifolium pratense]XP_045820399.1 uncharacterized protein LOC123913639 [Trifolium pratense]
MTNSIYDALALISAVKSVFKDENGEKYETFLEVLKDFKAGRIDRRDVKYRVYELFKGHQDLIFGFNKFMPTQYEIKLPMDHDDNEQQGRQLETNDALAFLKKVKDVFQGKNREKYDEFLEILKDFKAQRIHTSIVVERVKEMFKGHTDLISGFNVFLPNTFQIQLHTGRRSETEDASAFIEKVKDVFEVKNKEKYDEFLEILKDSKAGRIDRSVVAERVKEMFEGHTDLILGFNAFLPNTLQIQLRTGGKMKKLSENCEIPWDLLDIISRKLDFDDFFEFAGVCKNWREFHKIYWRNFLASQEPLLVQKSCHDKKCFNFMSIPDQRVYHSKMINHYWDFAYCGFSSGYMIMITQNNSFLLMNPFTRRKKIIHTSAFKVKFSYFAYHVLLAFCKGSEEFVFVALCNSSGSLHVYQSRNSCWVTYSTIGNPWKVVDFVVLYNTIYVVTDKAIIGVLDLNSANIKFLELKSTPAVTSSSHLRLVSCDGQLLVIHITSEEILNVYKIDFSTKNYVMLETLGDIALFYASGEYFYALSNPRMWGYETNSLHVINLSCTKCIVCVGDDNKLPEYIMHDTHKVPPREGGYLLDWCFKHLHYEVDYSPS